MSEADASPRTLPESPDALALLPMLYVAWADGVLTPSEVTLLRHRIESIDGLPADVREEVCPYLDPSNPPSPEVYDRWVQILRRHVEGLPADRRLSLADVGISIATAGGDGAPVSSSVRSALADLEGALGVDGPGMVRELRAHRPEPDSGDRVTRPVRFDVEALTRHLDGARHDHIEDMRTLLSDPAFAYPPKQTTAEYREQVMEWLRILADQGLGALSYPEKYGGGGDM